MTFALPNCLFSGHLLCYKDASAISCTHFSRSFMNADLRRRTDEVVSRLTQLRDSL
jgi:hypothetical protein